MVRNIIHGMPVIVALLIIWQFLGSLRSSAHRPNDRVRRLRFSDVSVPMKPVWRRKRLGRCDQE
jgi:hypothetical protein